MKTFVNIIVLSILSLTGILDAIFLVKSFLNKDEYRTFLSIVVFVLLTIITILYYNQIQRRNLIMIDVNETGLRNVVEILDDTIKEAKELKVKSKKDIESLKNILELMETSISYILDILETKQIENYLLLEGTLPKEVESKIN